MRPVCATCKWWLPNRPEFRVYNAGLCLNPKINTMTLAELGCDHHVASDYVLVNVPQHTRKGMEMQPNGNQVDGPVEIVIVTYGTPTFRPASRVVVSDLDWLHYALKSIRRFCTGFQGVTVVHPNHEQAMFAPLEQQYGVRLKGFDEVPGKGMIQHMAMMANADSLVPSGTKYVLLTDSDYVFRLPTTPEDYFCHDKPYYLVRSWESLTTEDVRNPGSKVVSDCAQWRGPTDAQIGFPSDVYSMCMNCAAFPIDFFKTYRAHIESIHGKPFMDYMLEGRNEHPATRMDWTAMGAFAYRHMHDRFTWCDVVNQPYPADRRLGFWSHGGISDQIRQQIELTLSRYVPTPEEAERMAQ